MKTFTSFREGSRVNWGRDLESTEQLTRDEINQGALLRMADATERMAKNHIDLQAEVERFKMSNERNKRKEDYLERSNAALRGQITKLRKRL